MQQVASIRAFPSAPVCFQVYTAPPKKASLASPPSFHLRLNPSLPSPCPLILRRANGIHTWGTSSYLSPALFSSLPIPQIQLFFMFLPPKLAARCNFSIKRAFSLSPLPSLCSRTHRWPLTTKAGCDSRRGEENRGIQEGKPWDVQLGDPGQAAKGWTLRPQHCALR